MKKIIVGSVVVIILIITSVATYFYLNPWETVSENGFSFSYPKKNTIQIYQLLNTDDYKGYEIKNSRINLDQSRIAIYLPLRNSGAMVSLADDVSNEADPSKIKEIILNGYHGKEITYRIDMDNSTGRVHIRTTQIHLDSQYPTAPVILQYFRTDSDASLDQAWEFIQKTLKY